MIVHSMPQRSPEWYAMRRGKITGSEIGKFVMNTDKKALDARQNLIDAKIGEEADGDDCEPNYETFWMKRGTRLEAEALSAYESYTGHEVEQVGFVSHDTLPLGVSPDALVNNRAFGLEMKCPSGKIQVKRLREKVCPDEYLPQIWLSMIVTGADMWHFWSYHPALPAFHIVVTRADIPAGFEPGVNALVAEYLRQRAWLESLNS
jgi:putative phage-type endonuclease